MSMSTAIGLGILAWVLLAIVLAFFLGHMIHLRDREQLGQARQGVSGTLRAPSAASPPARPGWDLHNGT